MNHSSRSASESTAASITERTINQAIGLEDGGMNHSNKSATEMAATAADATPTVKKSNADEEVARPTMMKSGMSNHR